MAKPIEYKIITLKSGKKVKFPVLTEASFTAGFRRKTRRLSEEAANEELLWLVFEEYLTEDEITVIDHLTPEELEELITTANEEIELPKD